MASFDIEAINLLKRNISMGKKICYKYLAAHKEMFVELSGGVLLAIISS